MIRGLFITGTDTGVGKTYIAAGIATALRALSVNIGVMKPAETGCVVCAGRLIPADAMRLVQASRVEDSLDLVNPYRFKEPLAPSVAAKREGRRISPVKIITAYHTLAKRHEFMLVEGAGGIMAPLWQKYLFLDLAEEIGLPVIIVARPGLGTINHTFLTISVLRARGIAVAGVVLNYSQNWKKGSAEKTNPDIIESLTGVRILGIVPYGCSPRSSVFRLLTKKILSA